MRPAPARLANIVLLMLSPATFLAAAELLLTLLGVELRPTADLIDVVVPELHWSTYRDLFSFDPDCLYINRSGAEYMPGDVINRLGLRGELPRLKRPGPSFRIACFGDSSTFGFGTAREDIYPERLKAQLQARLDAAAFDGGKPSARVELINAGVIGYTALQGLRLYQGKIAAYRPDLVTLAFGAINERRPGGQSDQERIQATRGIFPLAYEARSFLLSHLKLFNILAAAYRWLHAAVAWQSPRLRTETKRLSPQQYAKALIEFVQIARRQGAHVLLLSFPRTRTIEQRFPDLLEYTREMSRVGNRLQVPVLHLRQAFAAAPGSERKLFIDNYHPSVQGHRLIAQAIVDYLCGHELSCGPAGSAGANRHFGEMHPHVSTSLLSIGGNLVDSDRAGGGLLSANPGSQRGSSPGRGSGDLAVESCCGRVF